MWQPGRGRLEGKPEVRDGGSVASIETDGAEGAAVIVPYEDGPLLVRGDFTLLTQDGEPIDPGRATVALCRCGKSAIKPFCDGSHRLAGFHASSGREGGR
jgi:CDGSH-type Zn-finger protein